MDHIKIIKRAFSITWNYRALWVFGILLARTAGRTNGGSNGGGGSGGGNGSSGSGSFGPGNIQMPVVPQEVITTLVIVGIGLLCLGLILAIIGVVARYVSENALIRMVDQHEASGEKVSVRQGFRLGWNRAAGRLFLIDLLIGLGFIVAVLLSLLIAGAPLLVWLTNNTPLQVLGTVVAIGLATLFIFTIILVGIGVSLLLQIVHRACVLEDLGVIESIRRGWELLRQRLGDAVIMGLILFALGLGAAIIMIPVVILVFVVAAIIGGLPALLIGAITNLFVQGYVPWVLAALVGMPIFFLVVIVPLGFLSGLIETFNSTTWTLTYREIVALQAAKTPAVEPVI